MKRAATYRFEIIVTPGEDEEWERIAKIKSVAKRRVEVSSLLMDALTSGGLSESNLKLKPIKREYIDHSGLGGGVSDW